MAKAKKTKKSSSAISRKKVLGVHAYDIPNAEWKCPKCGKGVPSDTTGDGLIHEEAAVDLPEPWMGAEDYVQCYACDWSGSVEDVAKQVLNAVDLVECPCCHGEGSVDQERSAAFSQVPVDEADARRAIHIVERIARFAEESFTGYTILSAIAEEITMAQDFIKRRKKE